MENLCKQLLARVAAKRPSSGQALVQNHANRPHIRPSIQQMRLSPHLLRCHIGRRSRDLARPAALFVFMHR